MHVPQGRDDKVDKASGRSYWVWQGRGLLRSKETWVVVAPSCRTESSLTSCTSLGRPLSPILRAILVEEVLQCRFVIVQDRCREITGQDGIFRHEKVDMHFLLIILKALKKLSHIIF